jgi:hypothetical protein
MAARKELPLSATKDTLRMNRDQSVFFNAYRGFVS